MFIGDKKLHEYLSIDIYNTHKFMIDTSIFDRTIFDPMMISFNIIKYMLFKFVRYI